MPNGERDVERRVLMTPYRCSHPVDYNASAGRHDARVNIRDALSESWREVEWCHGLLNEWVGLALTRGARRRRLSDAGRGTKGSRDRLTIRRDQVTTTPSCGPIQRGTHDADG